jgi:hypothetical protein
MVIIIYDNLAFKWKSKKKIILMAHTNNIEIKLIKGMAWLEEAVI